MSIRIVDGSGNWQDVTDIRVVDIVGGTPTWKRVQKATVVDDTGKWQDAFIYDVTGPTAVTSASAEWSNSPSNRCNVTWTNPNVPDFSHTLLYRYKSATTLTGGQLAALSEGSWTQLGSTFTGINTVKTYADTGVVTSSFTTHGANQASSIHYFRFVPYDTRGNKGTASYTGSLGNGTAVVRGLYSSPYYIEPTDGGTWRGSSWRTDSFVADGSSGFTRTVQSMPSSPGDLNYGFYFYGSRPASGSIDATATEVRMQRNSSSGSSAAIAPQFRLSSHSSKSGDPTGSTFSSTVAGSGLTFSGSAWMSLTSTWGGLIITNTTWRSLNIYSATLSNYAIFFGSGDDASGWPGGTLRLTHGG